jgi:hypothetical protein
VRHVDEDQSPRREPADEVPLHAADSPRSFS